MLVEDAELGQREVEERDRDQQDDPADQRDQEAELHDRPWARCAPAGAGRGGSAGRSSGRGSVRACGRRPCGRGLRPPDRGLWTFGGVFGFGSWLGEPGERRRRPSRPGRGPRRGGGQRRGRGPAPAARRPGPRATLAGRCRCAAVPSGSRRRGGDGRRSGRRCRPGSPALVDASGVRVIGPHVGAGRRLRPGCQGSWRYSATVGLLAFWRVLSEPRGRPVAPPPGYPPRPPPHRLLTRGYPQVSRSDSLEPDPLPRHLL